jgi:hypothetical protein
MECRSVNIDKNKATCGRLRDNFAFLFTARLNKRFRMFSSLRKKWNVGTKEFLLILCVFAITGFTTAWLSKAVAAWIGLTDDTHWSARWSVRLAVLLFGYQVVLLLVAFLLGQFSFFWKFEKKMWQRLGSKKTKQSPPSAS